jgi:plastocyanin
MRKSIWAVLALAVLALVGLTFCKKEPEATTAQTPAQPMPPPPEQPAEPSAEALADAGPAAEGGTGDVEGDVQFTAAAPQPQALKRGLDPVCAQTPMNDETILVKDQKLQNVVVRILGPKGATAPAEPVVVNQEACMYRPRVQGAVKGQALKVLNSDKTLHNVHSYSGTQTLFNKAQPAKGAPFEEKMDASGVVKLKCDVHPWMTGYVVYSDNPFFATTGADGKFTIKGIPAGKYTLSAWHEKLGEKTSEVEVTAGGTTKMAVTY